MADISPFRGIRYRDDIALDDVVAPPYDVLSAAQAAELRARSPYNAVHVDLPVPPGAAADEEAYLRAAATFRTWRDEGVLVRDELPGIVVVDQTYTGPDGRERTRRGFVARLRLAGLDERVVLPHERTHAGPKVDRLRLYRATHADVSQIFLLFPDDDGAVGAQAGGGRRRRSPRPPGARRATATATGTRPPPSPARRPSASPRRSATAPSMNTRSLALPLTVVAAAPGCLPAPVIVMGLRRSRSPMSVPDAELSR